MKEEVCFDTRIDTYKLYVSMNARFVLRKDSCRDFRMPVYLHLTGNKKRERIFLDLWVDSRQWDEKNNRLKNTKENYDSNLILENVTKKITSIKTSYRLADRVLTPTLLKKELKENLPRVNFVSFCKYCLDEERQYMKPGTQKKNEAVYHKLYNYNDEIFFTEITLEWFRKYRTHLKLIGNNSVTINGNIIILKKYLRRAQKSGIKLVIDLDDVVGGSTKGNRNYLNVIELKKFYNYYFNEFIPESRRLALGYFLFSCFTGLRISDVQKIERKEVLHCDFQFVTTKTEKSQNIELNQKVKELIKHDENLFKTKFTDQFLNREIKGIATYLGVRKHITFHVARHTFATSFLRAGGKVQNLQKLLGHSEIKETMIYVHLVESEANTEIHLMDNLF